MQKGFKDVNLQGCVSGRFAVPVIGENGNWFIGNDDTGVSATGKGGGSNGGGDGVHYSTEEQAIGTWIDGSTLYRKTINFGALPSKNLKSVEHGIDDLDFLVKFTMIAKSRSGDFIDAPFVLTSSATNNTSVWASTTNIFMRTAIDYSHYSICYVTLEYTKISENA